MTELAVLQAIRLKGRVTAAELVATLDEKVDDVTEQLTASGLLVGGPTLRITPSGRERLDALLAKEREGADRRGHRGGRRRTAPAQQLFGETCCGT